MARDGGGIEMRHPICGFSLSAVVAIALMSPGLAMAQYADHNPTFAKDVAPILQRACQVCHRPNNMAPMSLMTYQEARPWARSIKQKVMAREMPPWHIDKNVGIQAIKGDRSLSDEEIGTIVRWVDAGAPMGNPADMPEPVELSDFGA